MLLFTIISLLIATSGAAYAVIAAIKEYADIYIKDSIKTAKEHLQNTDTTKSGNEELFGQAKSNYFWGKTFSIFYKISFFAPIIIFCWYIVKITLIVYKQSSPVAVIITEATWPNYQKMIFWVPIWYSIAVFVGLASMGVMTIFFIALKNKSKVRDGSSGNVSGVTKV